MSEHVPIAQVVLDPQAQPRTNIDSTLVDEYAREIAKPGGPALFPPIRAFYDASEERYYVGDGFHRTMAAEQAGHALIKAIVSPGTLRDAIVYSCSANADHGKRRTNEDKRRAVRRLLTDEEWSQWSDSLIAEKANVSQPFVSKLRKELQAETGQKPPEKRRAVRDGKEVTVRPGGGRPRKKGRKQMSSRPAESPGRTTSHPLDDAISCLNGCWSRVQQIQLKEDAMGEVQRRFEALISELHLLRKRQESSST